MIAAGFSLLLVSLERVYAVIFPLRHRTTRLAIYIAAFAITWSLAVFPFIVLRLAIYENNEVEFNLFYDALALLSLVIMIASYTAIFIKVKLQNQQHQQHQQEGAMQRAQKRERQLAMTLFIVTLLSVAAWLPFIIFQIPATEVIYISANLWYFIVLLQYTNSLINPVVYVFRMRDFRKALFQMMFKCSRDRGNVGHEVPIELRPR
jgi:ABC-type Fe3+ transport system permease subunit